MTLRGMQAITAASTLFAAERDSAQFRGSVSWSLNDVVLPLGMRWYQYLGDAVGALRGWVQAIEAAAET